ncbi:MAG: alpha-glucan family phosphorylase [Candidatus Woesearchaeota archaeon]
MICIFQTNEFVTYFSLEIGLDPGLPTYAGGLGILAGDTIKACADIGVPMVAVTLLNEDGYFHQILDAEGNQTEVPVKWRKEDFLEKIDTKVKVSIEGRDVYITVWKKYVEGIKGSIVEVLFLDTNLPENSEWDRAITKHLYGGNRWYRLCQEIVLGVGGIKMLRKLGFEDFKISKYHMNEGHAAFLTLELIKELQSSLPGKDYFYYRNMIKNKCVFTTHTPVPAGHDVFPQQYVQNALREYFPLELHSYADFNMTLLALNSSRHINGVAKRHEEVTQEMFPGYQINAITNGIHSCTWTGKEFADLFDEYLPDWRADNFNLRYALNIPPKKIWEAHYKQKRELIDYVNEKTDSNFKYDVFTIGFARRVAPYKRLPLLFSDIERLKRIAKRHPIQIVLSGKAHPNDGAGKDLIRQVFAQLKDLGDSIKVVFLPNYEMWLGKLMVSGVDIWLNTPQRPKEASGTSGMKAAHNGVPHFSVLDGWWLEGHVEGVTGWSIGPHPKEGYVDDGVDADSLYYKLETDILPKFYDRREEWIMMMMHTISHNASFFNTQRMVLQYVTNCYFL